MAGNYRIGNLIQHNWVDQRGVHHTVIKIHGIVKNMGVIVDSNMLPEYETIHFPKINHIKVTRQMLCDLGFFINESNENALVYIYSKRLTFAVVYAPGLSVVHEYHIYYGTLNLGFNYLHEFQNLFHALIGYELDLTLIDK